MSNYDNYCIGPAKFLIILYELVLYCMFHAQYISIQWDKPQTQYYMK